ncbi:hypothetical protein BS50DRAFT_640173 [Corynespora cassiicola Philippines]|uniref:Uncharacterized protein n=1 Tax=Corynespora cassiicola Philippines TaxID=1448308 RepID=A0A2T2N4R8_CORCC|nr:hypothetical protein BS50DRAFT_640173 [Corynespora cassiicola Philippines]
MHIFIPSLLLVATSGASAQTTRTLLNLAYIPWDEDPITLTVKGTESGLTTYENLCPVTPTQYPTTPTHDPNGGFDVDEFSSMIVSVTATGITATGIPPHQTSSRPFTYCIDNTPFTLIQGASTWSFHYQSEWLLSDGQCSWDGSVPSTEASLTCTTTRSMGLGDPTDAPTLTTRTWTFYEASTPQGPASEFITDLGWIWQVATILGEGESVSGMATGTERSPIPSETGASQTRESTGAAEETGTAAATGTGEEAPESTNAAGGVAPTGLGVMVGGVVGILAAAVAL